jgi:hypothetical protein
MSLSIAWPDAAKIRLGKSQKKRKVVVEKPYHTVYKNNTQNWARYLAKNWQALLPMVELIEQSQLVIEKLIDVLGRAHVEAVLHLAAESMAVPRHLGKKLARSTGKDGKKVPSVCIGGVAGTGISRRGGELEGRLGRGVHVEPLGDLGQPGAVLGDHKCHQESARWHVAAEVSGVSLAGWPDRAATDGGSAARNRKELSQDLGVTAICGC